MKFALVRAARTFAQAFLGVYMAGLMASESTLSSFVEVGLLDSATAAGLVASLTFAQNVIEEMRVKP